jgi:hypothetical protein
MNKQAVRGSVPFSWLGPVCLAGFLLLAGCAGRVGPLEPVEGKATVDGKPLTEGFVAFVPVQQASVPLEIRGTVEADGSYKMSTNGKPGVPKGRYKVTVNTLVPGKVADPSQPLPAKPAAGPAVPARKANVRYENADSTVLSVEVPAGPFELKLTR